jgi:hypothetical protein
VFNKQRESWLALGIFALLTLGLLVPGISQDQYSVSSDVIALAESATVQAITVRDFVLLALSSVSVQDALKNLERVLGLLDSASGVLASAKELQRIAQEKRWTEVNFAVGNVVALYENSARKSAQTAIEIGKRITNPTAAVSAEMKNAIRELFAYVTTSLGAAEDPITLVTAGGLRTIRDFLKRQKGQY